MLILGDDIARDDGVTHCRRIKSRPNPPAVVVYSVPQDAFEATVARLDHDLPVFVAMLLDREPVDSIAQVLRVDRSEVNRRAQRIVGRLRPRRSVSLDNDAVRTLSRS